MTTTTTQFPWEVLKAETLRSVIIDIGGPSWVRSKQEIIEFVKDVERDGVEKAVEARGSAPERISVKRKPTAETKAAPADAAVPASSTRSKRQKVGIQTRGKTGVATKKETEDSKPAAKKPAARRPRKKNAKKSAATSISEDEEEGEDAEDAEGAEGDAVEGAVNGDTDGDADADAEGDEDAAMIDAELVPTSASASAVVPTENGNGTVPVVLQDEVTVTTTTGPNGTVIAEEVVETVAIAVEGQ